MAKMWIGDKKNYLTMISEPYFMSKHYPAAMFRTNKEGYGMRRTENTSATKFWLVMRMVFFFCLFAFGILAAACEGIKDMDEFVTYMLYCIKGIVLSGLGFLISNIFIGGYTDERIGD